MALTSTWFPPSRLLMTGSVHTAVPVVMAMTDGRGRRAPVCAQDEHFVEEEADRAEEDGASRERGMHRRRGEESARKSGRRTSRPSAIGSDNRRIKLGDKMRKRGDGTPAAAPATTRLRPPQTLASLPRRLLLWRSGWSLSMAPMFTRLFSVNSAPPLFFTSPCRLNIDEHYYYILSSEWGGVMYGG